MGIKFKIYRETDGQQIFYLEKVFPDEQSMIKIGRGVRENDVILKDDFSQVSKEHAVITRRDGKYFLQDLNSTNGTVFNNVRLVGDKETELNADSSIKIANFTFVGIEITGESEVEATEYEMLLQYLAGALRSVYQAYAAEPERRKTAIESTINTFLKKNPKIDKVKFLHQLKEKFPDRSYEWMQLLQENRKLRAFASDKGLMQSAYLTLTSLTRELFFDEVLEFHSQAEMESFCKNVKYTLQSLINAIVDLESGRQQILDDFLEHWHATELESPLVNKTPEDMIKILLDWHFEDSGNGVTKSSQLEAALKTLIVHEIALLKGYQEATHKGALELLDFFNPKALAYESGIKEFKVGPIKVPYKIFPPLVWWQTWKAYQQTFFRLKREDASFFEKIFRRSFARRYQEIVRQSNLVKKNLEETRTFYKNELKTIEP